MRSDSRFGLARSLGSSTSLGRRIKQGLFVLLVILCPFGAPSELNAQDDAEALRDDPIGDLTLAEPLPGGTWIVVAGIAVLLLATWLNRRFGLGASAPRAGLRMIGTLPLGDKRAIALVEAGDQKMLVGITPQHVNLLCQLPDSEDEQDSTPRKPKETIESSDQLASPGFVSILKNAFQRQERSS